MERLESKLQLEKLFQTAIVTHQHVFYFRFNQVPQNARLPHPPTQQRPAQPHLLPCLRSRAKGWQLGQVSPPFRALFAMSKAPWPQQDGSSGCQAPCSCCLGTAAHGDTGTLSRHSAGGTWLGTGTARLGWLPCRGLERGWGPLAGCPLPCPSRCAGSPVLHRDTAATCCLVGRRCPRLPARGQEMPGAAALSLTPEPGAPPCCAS